MSMAPESTMAPSSDARLRLDNAEKALKIAPQSTMDSKSFPDVGSDAYFTTVGCSACLLWLGQNYRSTDLSRGTSRSKVAWIASIQCANVSSELIRHVSHVSVSFILFGGISEGDIFDFYGPCILITNGTFLHVFGLVMASIST